MNFKFGIEYLALNWWKVLDKRNIEVAIDSRVCIGDFLNAYGLEGLNFTGFDRFIFVKFRNNTNTKHSPKQILGPSPKGRYV